jgi:WD40 repeat protein
MSKGFLGLLTGLFLVVLFSLISCEETKPLSGLEDGAIPLTTEFDSYDPAWSPNTCSGVTRIAYLGSWEKAIFIMYDDGSHKYQLSPWYEHEGAIEGICWNPNSLEWEIAFGADMDGGDCQIYTAKVYPPFDHPFEPVQVTTDGGSCPTWSPDGSTIVYVNNYGDICKIPASGGIATQLVAGGRDPCFSPDGRFIAYSLCDANGWSAIWTIPVDGGEPTHLIGGENQMAFCPSWSPDGLWIAYSFCNGDLGEDLLDIWKIPCNGGVPVQITAEPDAGLGMGLVGAINPTWSPDSLWIAFESSRVVEGYGSSSKIFKMRAN